MSDQLWNILLLLKQEVYSFSGVAESVWISRTELKINPEKGDKISEGVLIFFERKEFEKSTERAVFVSEKGVCEFENFSVGKFFDPDVLKLFLPFCLAPIIRQKNQTPLSFTHFAQTLDGYIATLSNHSQWIGNDENLVHAHRIRALVDAVVIGNNTLRADKPRLNVRHVKGKNPHKVVIGNSVHKLDSLLAKNANSHGEKIIRVSSVDNSYPLDTAIEQISIDSPNGKIPSGQILKALFDKNIYSVLIEGGSFTSSVFLKEGNIDILQLHIAPVLFGSGIKTFSLPEINTVCEGQYFDHTFYTKIGDAMMFTGFLKE